MWMPLTNGACVANSVSITVSIAVQRRSKASHRLSTMSQTTYVPVPVGFTCMFGHIARAGPGMDHCRALHAATNNPPRDWKRGRGRPAHTWTRTAEADLKSCNSGLHSAWHRAQDRNKCCRLVQSTAVLCPRLGSTLDDDNPNPTRYAPGWGPLLMRPTRLKV